jgi:hypothetical protein
MQQQFDPKLVSKTQDAVSNKTLETINHVFFSGLMQSLRLKCWDPLKIELVAATSTFLLSIEGSVQLS